MNEEHMNELPIYTFSRADAIREGDLVDVTKTAHEAGFKAPVAVTRALWADIEAIPKHRAGIESVDGRLWDVLWMGFCAIRTSRESGRELVYPLRMTIERRTNYQVKLMSGPGDNGELVITLMKPGQD